MLFGLTKRPMVESYTRALWLELAAKEVFAKQVFKRDMSNTEILLGEKNFPSLNHMWDDLQKKDVLPETIDWIQKKRTWWNDSAHIGPNAAYMGWSNEYVIVFHDNQSVVRNLHTLLEIGTQCAGRFYVLHNGGVDASETTNIHRKGEQLRSRVASLRNVE